MLQHFNPINQILIFPKIAIRKLFFGLFYHPLPLFIIPHFSVILPLSVIPPIFVILSVFFFVILRHEVPKIFCHTPFSVILPPFFLVILRHEVPKNPLLFCHSERLLLVILRLRQQPKNPLLL